jgi:uncharacterized protein YndB with AHSA1/START domain
MTTLHFNISVDASKKKVWETMLQDASYREWTRAFNPAGSWYEGDWNQGSEIRFIGAGENGTVSGMVGRIKESRPYDFLSIEHLGVIHQGKEDTTSDAVKQWAPAFENYTFKDRDGATEVLVDMDADEQHAAMFEQMWPNALQKLKELAER